MKQNVAEGNNIISQWVSCGVNESAFSRNTIRPSHGVHLLDGEEWMDLKASVGMTWALLLDKYEGKERELHFSLNPRSIRPFASRSVVTGDRVPLGTMGVYRSLPVPSLTKKWRIDSCFYLSWGVLTLGS